MMEQHICSRGLGQTPASGKDIYFSIACCCSSKARSKGKVMNQLVQKVIIKR